MNWPATTLVAFAAFVFTLGAHTPAVSQQATKCERGAGSSGYCSMIAARAAPSGGTPWYVV